MNNISSLDRHEFTTWKDGIKASSTPYDKFLTNYENNILPALEKSSKEYIDDWFNRDINDQENVDRKYYLAIKKALDNAETGKDYTEIMRLLITNANLTNENTEGILYENLPTPEQSTRIFMEMWAKQFATIKDMTERTLQEFIRAEFPKVGIFPEETMIKSLNPNNMNEKEMLKNLKEVIPNFSLFCKDILVHNTKEGDIKVLYAMKLLEEKLEKKLIKSENSKKINDLKNKL